MSQEELASRLDSSPRHLSRLENGSSRPSAAFVRDVITVLDLGERDSNHLYVAAGFAPVERNVDLNSPTYRWLKNAMRIKLLALDPYPSVLLDSDTNIVMINRAWAQLFGEKTYEGQSYYEFLFSGAAEIEDKSTLVSVVMMSLQQQALLDGKESMRNLVESLAKHPDVPSNWREIASNIEPMASYRITLNINGDHRPYFNVSSAIGAQGPTGYGTAPHLTLHTLYPEEDLAPLTINNDIHHPLLFIE